MNCISSAGQTDINNKEEAKGPAKLPAWLPTGPCECTHLNWVSNAYLASYAASPSPSVSLCLWYDLRVPQLSQNTNTYTLICMSLMSEVAHILLCFTFGQLKMSGVYFVILIMQEDWLTNNFLAKGIIVFHLGLLSYNAMQISSARGQRGQKDTFTGLKISSKAN